MNANIKGCIEALNSNLIFNEIKDGMLSEEAWELLNNHFKKIEAVIGVLEDLSK